MTDAADASRQQGGLVAAAATGEPARPFVGRVQELRELRAALEEAAARQGCLLLLSGEPGIGKSRLMEELARQLPEQGWRVLVGRCWEHGGAPAYWPWTQVVRAAGRELLECVPSTPTAADPEAARFLLFDAVGRFLRTLASSGPVLVALDDLHAADEPSLLLLRFLAQTVTDERVVIVGAYRGAEPRVHELAEVFGDLARVGRRVRLRGLSRAEVGDYMGRLAGRPPPAAVVVSAISKWRWIAVAGWGRRPSPHASCTSRPGCCSPGAPARTGPGPARCSPGPMASAVSSTCRGSPIGWRRSPPRPPRPGRPVPPGNLPAPCSGAKVPTGRWPTDQDDRQALPSPRPAPHRLHPHRPVLLLRAARRDAARLVALTRVRRSSLLSLTRWKTATTLVGSWSPAPREPTVEAAAMANTTPSQPDPGSQPGSGDGAEPGGQSPARGGGSSRPARQFRPSRGRRVGDAIIGVFARAGLVPSTYLLTTRGRKTGRPLTHPVTMVEHNGRRWLVAPYGPVSWVHNARAAGRVSVARRGDRHDYAIREVPAEEAGPVLKRYVAVATATRPYFQADKDAPVEDFVAEADRHPVFELLPINEEPHGGQGGP